MNKMKYYFLLSVITFLMMDASFAQVQFPGIIDSTFGTNGKVVSSFNNFDCVGRAMAVQTDGKIIVAGESSNGTTNRFGVIRYLSNGSLDNQFGTGGKVTFSFGQGNSVARAIAIQNDGKIVVAGNLENQTYSNFAVARLTTSGVLDNTFGAGGIVQTSLDPGFDLAYGVAIQSDGKIVLGGVSFDTLANGEFAVVRYNTNGTLDGSFGNSGKVRTPLGTQWDQANAIAIEPVTGKIILAGRTYSSYAMARYNSNGTLDPSFGLGGIASYSIGTLSEIINTITLTPDLKIIAGGTTQTGNNTDMILMRFLNNGSIDVDFGAGGLSIFDLGGTDIIFSLAQQGDYLVGAGSRFAPGTGEFVVMRFDSLGSFDALFNGTLGYNITSFTGIAGANAIAIQQPDSKIVLAGATTVGAVNNFALARYTSDFTFVGINDIQSSTANIRLLPNPTADFLRIESEMEFNSVTLKDISGKTVYQIYFKEGYKSYSISTKNFSKGIYFCEITQQGQTMVKKCVIAD
jgi:uncharacterized delta-60 repeat protein